MLFIFKLIGLSELLHPGVQAPLVLYTDRDCCSLSGPSKYQRLFNSWPHLEVRFNGWTDYHKIIFVVKCNKIYCAIFFCIPTILLCCFCAGPIRRMALYAAHGRWLLHWVPPTVRDFHGQVEQLYICLGPRGLRPAFGSKERRVAWVRWVYS